MVRPVYVDDLDGGNASTCTESRIDTARPRRVNFRNGNGESRVVESSVETAGSIHTWLREKDDAPAWQKSEVKTTELSRASDLSNEMKPGMVGSKANVKAPTRHMPETEMNDSV